MRIEGARKYYLSEDEILNILRQDGLIVFDTSALLALYYFSDEARKNIYNIVLDNFKDRLWIPGQVFFEFSKNREKVSKKPLDSYRMLNDSGCRGDGNYIGKINDLSKQIGSKQLVDIKGQIETLKERTKNKKSHPYIEQNQFDQLDLSLKGFEKNYKKFLSDIQKFTCSFNAIVDEKIAIMSKKADDVEEQIVKYFTIGEELSFSEMMSIVETEGKNRYEEEIPPGYKDSSSKAGLQKYGDLFIWKQILAHTMECQKDMLFVTNDVKEDWWDEQLSAPRFELLKEYNSITGKRFWSCEMDTFLYLFNKANKGKNVIPESDIEEVSDVTETGKAKKYEDEAEPLYISVIREWLENETEYKLGEKMPKNTEWRIFGQSYIYQASCNDDENCLIVINIVKKFNYANVLHAINNGREIKGYYKRFGLEYRIRQLIVTNSEIGAKSLQKTIETYAKLRRMFDRKDIENTLVCLGDGELLYVDSNHLVG